MKAAGLRSIGALVLVLAVAAAAFALEVPYLSGRVNDRAGMIDPATEERLESKLAGFESETGAQIVVVTIQSLEGEVLEDYSLRLAETWGLGRADADDGVLILIARNDRKMRIEVGYGLEGQLTDLQAGRVLDRVMAPSFKRGEFAHGIEAGVDAIIDTVRGVEVEALVGSNRTRSDQMPWQARAIGLTVFTVNVGIFSVIALLSSGFASWFLYLFLMPFYFAFPQALIGREVGLGLFGLWVIGFPILKWILGRSGAGKRFMKAHPSLEKAFNNERSRSWSSGRGGGFSSGGFSGGGGSFGGGGSSGSW